MKRPLLFLRPLRRLSETGHARRSCVGSDQAQLSDVGLDKNCALGFTISLHPRRIATAEPLGFSFFPMGFRHGAMEWN
jgi:hypothetical protein